ncbi:MAG TPA: hypothetical protein DEA96_17890 [Leptospiraceae bacterium]|nr:hypothetical protein [Spirochaetaceae bacterium]HBS06847.1 hypothetical protein [Leptospiraceae bacterium]
MPILLEFGEYPLENIGGISMEKSLERIRNLPVRKESQRLKRIPGQNLLTAPLTGLPGEFRSL